MHTLTTTPYLLSPQAAKRAESEAKRAVERLARSHRTANCAKVCDCMLIASLISGGAAGTLPSYFHLRQGV